MLPQIAPGRAVHTIKQAHGEPHPKPAPPDPGTKRRTRQAGGQAERQTEKGDKGKEEKTDEKQEEKERGQAAKQQPLGPADPRGRAEPQRPKQRKGKSVLVCLLDPVRNQQNQESGCCVCPTNAA